MPLYTYECKSCGKGFDKVYPIKDYPRETSCDYCGESAKKVLSIGHGGIQTDNDVTWLPSACDVLQRPTEPRLQTRSEWRDYLKKESLTPIG